MTSFRHAGDLGDVIYALPTIRHFGGGDVFLEAAPFTRVSLSRDRWCGIDKLLLAQPYVTRVAEYLRGQYCTFNLNSFRDRLGDAMRKGQHHDKSLCDWVLETHNVPLSAKDTAWLAVEPTPIAPVVINRTGAGRPKNSRYHGWAFPWHSVWRKYGQNAVFIGTRAEHEMFCATCGHVAYHETKDLLEAAQVIAGALLFVGNQSVCHAISCAMKKRILLEVWPEGPNVLEFREGVTHGWDETVQLPEL